MFVASSGLTVIGHGVATLYGPDGRIKVRERFGNLITQIGEQLYAEAGAGISGAPASPTGMRLGLDDTAPAKTDTGAALGTYLAGSGVGLDDDFPASTLNSGARRISYQCTWGDGVANSADPITEIVIVNDTIATDATSAAANTISRALLSSIASKGPGDTLQVLWHHDLLAS